jgi:hypothetical protein
MIETCAYLSAFAMGWQRLPHMLLCSSLGAVTEFCTEARRS